MALYGVRKIHPNGRKDWVYEINSKRPRVFFGKKAADLLAKQLEKGQTYYKYESKINPPGTYAD